MTNPALPTGFTPTVAAYGMTGPDGVMRSDINGGPSRYALEYDRGVQQFNVTLVLDKLQFSVFTAWFLHVVKKGAITFDMPLDSGFGTAPHACNILPGSYSTSRVGGILTSISFVVEAENQAYELSTQDAQGLVDMYNEYGEDVDLIMARIAQFANVDSLALNF